MTTKRKSAAVSTSRSKKLLAPDWAYPTIADWEECADRKAHPAFCAGFRCARAEEQPGDWQLSGNDWWPIGYDMGRTTNAVIRKLARITTDTHKEVRMYKYHVHAMYFDGCNTHHWDGLVTRSDAVLSGDDYDDCKRRLVADAFPGVDDPSRVIINSMSPMWPIGRTPTKRHRSSERSHKP